MIYRIYKLCFKDICIRVFFDWFYKFLDNHESESSALKCGVWTENTQSIKESNVNLVKMICDKAGLKETEKKEDTEKKEYNILDIGCGRGATTRLLYDELKKRNIKCNITAIDNCKNNIYYANNHYFSKNITFYSDLNSLIKKHNNIQTVNSDIKFDVVFSLESAYKSKNRPQLFKDIYTLLAPNGTLVITDITISKPYSYKNLTSLIKYFCIPEQNRLTTHLWEKQLCELFSKKEVNIYTKETFEPYLQYFTKNNSKTNMFSETLFISFYKKLIKYQPFEYVIGVFYKSSPS